MIFYIFYNIPSFFIITSIILKLFIHILQVLDIDFGNFT